MDVSREEAIRRATDFANANGYRVVECFDNVPWVENPRPVELDAARWVNGKWAVVFGLMLHPPGVVECPDCVIVAVPSNDKACSFFETL